MSNTTDAASRLAELRAANERRRHQEQEEHIKRCGGCAACREYVVPLAVPLDEILGVLGIGPTTSPDQVEG